MQLKRIRNSITHKVALQLYKCMIMPFIDSADIFCHNKIMSLLNKFQTIQNCCIRIISKLSRLTNTDNETIRLNLITLAEQRAPYIVEFAHEIAFKQPKFLTSYDFASSAHTIQRGLMTYHTNNSKCSCQQNS